MRASFRYVTSNKGINSATHYPYRARVSTNVFTPQLFSVLKMFSCAEVIV